MIACAPTVSALVVQVATPATNVTPPHPAMAAAPLSNATFPVGVPDPGALAVTAAVNVTDWPNTVGFTVAVTTVVVGSAVTTWVMTAEVLAVLLASPL